MKKLIFFFIVSIIASINSFSQSLQLETNEVLHNNILRSSIQLTLTPTTKEVKKAWKNYLDDNYDVDVDGYGLFNKKDILTANTASIRPISDKQIDLYAKVVEDGGMTRMNVYGAFGNDSFMTPSDNPEEFTAMRTLVSEFIASFLPNYFAEVVDDTQDDVKDAADHVADLEKKIKKNKEKIIDLTEENIDLTTELTEARKMLSKSKEALNKDKKKLEKVKNKVSKTGSGIK